MIQSAIFMSHYFLSSSDWRSLSGLKMLKQDSCMQNINGRLINIPAKYCRLVKISLTFDCMYMLLGHVSLYLQWLHDCACKIVKHEICNNARHILPYITMKTQNFVLCWHCDLLHVRNCVHITLQHIRQFYSQPSCYWTCCFGLTKNLLFFGGGLFYISDNIFC